MRKSIVADDKDKKYKRAFCWGRCSLDLLQLSIAKVKLPRGGIKTFIDKEEAGGDGRGCMDGKVERMRPRIGRGVLESKLVFYTTKIYVT